VIPIASAVLHQLIAVHLLRDRRHSSWRGTLLIEVCHHFYAV